MKFKPYNQSQGIFKTIIPNELLEADHPARIIDKVAEMLDYSGMEDEYEEEGNVAYNVKMMTKVLFYAYYRNIFSCRKIWDSLKVRADFIYLSGDQMPNFRTINRFRSRHPDKMSELFTQIVILCAEMGMVGFEEMAIDSEKIRANADWRKSKNKESLEESYHKVKAGIKNLLEKDINEYFTEEKKDKRIKKLRKQENKLRALKRVLESLGKDRLINMTDPDAKVMQHKDKRKLPSYTHESAVDGQYGVTTAVRTLNREEHPEDLFELADKSKENTGRRHKKLLADSGFCDYERLEEAAEKRLEAVYMPDKRFQAIVSGETKKGEYDLSKFKIRKNGVRCPEGYRMKEISKQKDYPDGHTVTIYAGTQCLECPVRKKCTKDKVRKIALDSRYGYQERMRQKLSSDKGREIYIRRQAIVEGPHGHDQKNKGWIQHHLRGLEKAGLEFQLIRIAANIGKIVKFRAKEMLAMA